jgi:hypothetical protein
LEQVHQPDADNINSAGLVLDSDAANQLVVVSVSATADQITRKNVLPGDIILQIEGKSETPWTIPGPPTSEETMKTGRAGNQAELRPKTEKLPRFEQ